MIVLIFTLIVVVHEYGHFITAKKMDVKVNEFAVGMGPLVWSLQKGETLYSIRLLPIGGFCSMEGETDDSDSPRALNKKKPGQRLIIFVAGAVMNFLLAWLLLALVIGVRGYGTNVVASVEPGMPAAQAGLQIGDKITAINGRKVQELQDITTFLQDKTVEENYTLDVIRSDKTETYLQIKAQWIEEDGRLRFGFSTTRSHWNIFRNIKNGFITSYQMVAQVMGGLWQIITGQVGVKDLAGIVGIAQISSEAWNEGIKISLWTAIENMLLIGALLSSNLAVMNLLPLPALDGGRILFTLIEIIRGKAINPEREAMIHFMGFVLLMGLMIFILYNDIMRIVG
jgi:regulator of sigma E protease